MGFTKKYYESSQADRDALPLRDEMLYVLVTVIDFYLLNLLPHSIVWFDEIKDWKLI